MPIFRLAKQDHSDSLAFLYSDEAETVKFITLKLGIVTSYRKTRIPYLTIILTKPTSLNLILTVKLFEIKEKDNIYFINLCKYLFYYFSGEPVSNLGISEQQIDKPTN